MVVSTGLNRLSATVSAHAAGKEKKVSMAMMRRADAGCWGLPQIYVNTMTSCRAIQPTTMAENCNSGTGRSGETRRLNIHRMARIQAHDAKADDEGRVRGMVVERCERSA